MGSTAGEAPKQKAINCTEGELAIFGSRTSAIHVIEQPRDLAGGKIWIEQQTGPAHDATLVAGATQRLAIPGSTSILPKHRVLDRLAVLPVPNARVFTLIGDADSGDVPCRDLCLRHHGPYG